MEPRRNTSMQLGDHNTQHITYQAPTQPTPAALPRGTAGFTGRDSELRRLLRAAEDGHNPVDLAALITQYLSSVASGTTGTSEANGISELIRNRLNRTESGNEALARLVEAPDDPERNETIQDIVSEILSTDPTFVAQVRDLTHAPHTPPAAPAMQINHGDAKKGGSLMNFLIQGDVRGGTVQIGPISAPASSRLRTVLLVVLVLLPFVAAAGTYGVIHAALISNRGGSPVSAPRAGVTVTASRGATDEWPASGAAAEPAPESSTPGTDTPRLSPFIYLDGSGVTLCGENFPQGETLHFTWVFHSGNGPIKSYPFRKVPSVLVKASGGFSSVDDDVPPNLPDGTLQVHVAWGSSASELPKPLTYHTSVGIDRGNSGPAVCPF